MNKKSKHHPVEKAGNNLECWEHAFKQQIEILEVKGLKRVGVAFHIGTLYVFTFLVVQRGRRK